MKNILQALNQSSVVSYVVDSNLCLAYCNPAWDRFAVENSAPELARATLLGTDLRSVLGKDLRPFYLQAFEQVAHSGTVWDCLYECSSPQLFRKFQMRIHPLRPEGWYLVTNTLVIEKPHTATVTSGLEGYVNCDGQITVCSHCRSSRHADRPEQWDFVPVHLERNLANISHGLCPICLEYFYPKPK